MNIFVVQALGCYRYVEFDHYFVSLRASLHEAIPQYLTIREIASKKSVVECCAVPHSVGQNHDHG